MFLTGTAAVAINALRPAVAAVPRSGVGRERSIPKAIAFDGFPIIDSRPVGARAEKLFPGHGEALLTAWRTRQFEYTWLRTMGGRYADFWQTTQEALVFAATSLGLPLSADIRDRLMQTYLELKAWPDVLPAIQKLRNAGIRLAFLSNFTVRMLDAALGNSGIRDYFEPHLSTDLVRAFKPDPRAYAMALRAFRVSKDEITFCAAAGWDAAGAKWFGYRTFWVNRSKQPPEEMGVCPDGIGASMTDLSAFALRE